MRATRLLQAIRCGAAVVAIAAAGTAQAVAPLLLDDFSGPSSPGAGIVFPPTFPNPVTLSDSGLSVPGGVRETTFNVYANPVPSLSSVLVGGGVLSVAQGAGAMAETLVAYGAFAGGPSTGLDLTAYSALQFSFLATQYPLNVNVTYYTSSPLDSVTYYSTSGVNIGPAVPGGPLTFALGFASTPGFNWSDVDGVVLIINRSGPIPASAYTLDQVTFVPEPSTYAMLIAGLAALGFMARRRTGA